MVDVKVYKEQSLQSQSGRDRAALQAQLLQQGFGQAQQARQQDIQNRFGLGQAQSGLGQAQAGQQQLGLGLKWVEDIPIWISGSSTTITKSRYIYTRSSRCSATSTRTS